tara:strand:+ start:334 stop:552 length:219 start_codon:yes stop_codon:yes gene_type:complete
MIVKKVLKNQIERIIKQKMGINPDARKIKRLENSVRVLQGEVANLKNMAHFRRNLVQRNGKYYLEEENEENG